MTEIARPARAASLLLIVVLVAACGSATTDPALPPQDQQPPGADVSSPFPIDRGDEGGHVPGTYKGLWLRLVDNGKPVVTPMDGIIGIVCVGMSNATQECARYVWEARGAWAPEIDSVIRVVDCAVGGHAIERWNDPDFDVSLWDDCIQRKLPAAGIQPHQVRVIYHKAANQFTVDGTRPLPFYPAVGSDYANFLTNLTAFAARVPVKFPSVQAVYTTARSYGGFATNQTGRGEPLSYEEGHALNTWLRGHPHVGTVWYGWGPYIWAPPCGSGVNGTGMCYERSDYVADGVHPSESGRLKIARAIHERLLQEAWYRR